MVSDEAGSGEGAAEGGKESGLGDSNYEKLSLAQTGVELQLDGSGAGSTGKLKGGGRATNLVGKFDSTFCVFPLAS